MAWQKVFDDPEVFLIRVPFQNVITTETNVYVIRSGEDVLLVDLGAPTEDAAGVLRAALAEIGVELSCASVFFTHLHYDHAGLGCRLPVCCDAIYVNALEMRAAQPSFATQLSKHVAERFMTEGMDEADARAICAVVQITTPIAGCVSRVEEVAEGDIIRVGPFGFEVIDLPGHTRGMQGLFQRDTGLCFAGDQLLFQITPSVGLFLDGADSVAAYETSMRKLMALPITHLLHSHGDLRPDFRERAERILRSREQRLEAIVGIIGEANRAGYEPTGIEVIERIGWNIPFPSIAECEAKQRWLIYTQGIALLDRLANEHRIVRKREPATQGNALFTNSYSLPTLVDNKYF